MEEDLIPFSDDEDGWCIDDDPCADCADRDFCDGWEMRYCCYRCHQLGLDDCDNCDPMDI